MPLQALVKRIQLLSGQYLTQQANLIQEQGRHSELPSSRWYFTQIQQLQRLLYFLQKLQGIQSSLLIPSWNLHQLFDYLKTGDLLPTLALIRQLLPSILQSYRSLVQDNVAAFSDRLALFTHP